MVWLLIFSVFYFLQAWFAGEKVGEGTGKTRREAQRQAAEGSIKKLAGKISFTTC
jgi:RNA polymerase II C-terminal domain phosphatase-like 1/2